MTQQEAIEKLYIQWHEWGNECYSGKTIDDYYTEKQKKCIFLSSAIIGITTYDDELSAEFGAMILETLVQIKNRTTFEYIKNEDNYKKYILSCNFIENWLNWGTSIRGAWFDYFDGCIKTSEYLGNIGYDKDDIKITEEFMNWFVEWLTQ